jgi:hypothetical protein
VPAQVAHLAASGALQRQRQQQRYIVSRNASTTACWHARAAVIYAKVRSRSTAVRLHLLIDCMLNF